MEVEVGKHKLPEEKAVEVLYKNVSFLKRNPALTAFAALILIAGGVSLFIYLQQQADKTEKAWSALFMLNDMSDLESVEEAAKDTSAEPIFLLESGRMLFDKENRTAEDLAQAERVYRKFCTKYQDHPGIEFAKQSLAYVQEEQGNYEGALKLFTVLAQSGSHLSNESMWDAGRCAELAGKLDIAKDFYKRLRDDGARPWSFYAGTRLAEILSEERNREEANDG